MFAETNEDLPLISGFALTQAAEMPLAKYTPVVVTATAPYWYSTEQVVQGQVLDHMITKDGTLFYHVRPLFADDAWLDGDWTPAHNVTVSR